MLGAWSLECKKENKSVKINKESRAALKLHLQYMSDL